MTLKLVPLRILIVDRDDLTRELFATLLNKHECIVNSTSNPAEALELAKTAIPDVIFSSLIFNGINGFELCRKLWEIPNFPRY